MGPNNMLSVMAAEEATEHAVQSLYLSALFTVNVTTPSPSSIDNDFVVFSNPAKIHRIVETVGIVAALAVGAIIIIGVAFIMSKLRKRQAASASDPEEQSGCEVVMETNMASLAAQQQHVQEANIPHYDIKHVYSITGVIASSPPLKSKRSFKTTLLPNFLKKKGAALSSNSAPAHKDLACVHEALKKDLSRIYVY